MADALEIWLYGHQVAVVEKERNNRLRLSYTEYALETYEGGTPLLSLAFPLTRERYPNAATRAFLDGLLPEGEPRRAIAADLDLAASDVSGLLASLGRDCAGALVIQPRDAPPPPPPTTLTAQALTADELATLIANLHRAPLASTSKTPGQAWPASRAPCRTSPSPRPLRRSYERSRSTSRSATATRTPRTSRCCTLPRARCDSHPSTTCCPRGSIRSRTSSRCTSTPCKRQTA